MTPSSNCSRNSSPRIDYVCFGKHVACGKTEPTYHPLRRCATNGTVDLHLAIQGGLYRRDYSKSHNVGFADALIAATATQRQVSLVTLNRKHCPMFVYVVDAQYFSSIRYG